MTRWKKLKEWWHFRVMYWKGKRGWEFCPDCARFVRPRWIKEWIHHPEEPPLFCRYQCPECGYTTGVNPTGLTEETVRRMGYKNFLEYAQKAGLLKGAG